MNPDAINEFFPVPGQDNDTQVFRDNFSTIKSSLFDAKNRIEAIEEDYASLSRNEGNDFNLKEIKNAVLVENREKLHDGESPNTAAFEIDWMNGSYQIYRFGENSTTITFSNLPGDSNNPAEDSAPKTVGRLTLELYSEDDTEKTITFNSINGAQFRRNESSSWTDNLTNNTIASITVNSSANPVFIEVWRRTTVSNQNYIFLRYLGQYA
jgi:hypothetical protein